MRKEKFQFGDLVRVSDEKSKRVITANLWFFINYDSYKSVERIKIEEKPILDSGFRVIAKQDGKNLQYSYVEGQMRVFLTPVAGWYELVAFNNNNYIHKMHIEYIDELQQALRQIFVNINFKIN